ncbi:MAG: 4-hydroxy-tetrahydrodipicolinate reductase [Candidatus Eisenbacteria bacterium]|nr:4-hydroxy-tetrahydrodipicolinate reductase [Candidatus Eisenbacteria bacterium]
MKASHRDPLRVVVVGAAGRMGRMLRRVIEDDPRFTVAAHVDRNAPRGEAGWFGALGEVSTGADGVIEFTLGGAVGEIARAAAAKGWPLVSAATGLSPDDEAGLQAAAGTIPVLHASNLSLGMALLRRCLREVAARAPEGVEAEIVEIHHGGKRDAPSGTARALFGDWSRSRSAALREVHGRSGAAGPRRSDEVGVHAVRLGNVVGEHRVFLALPGGERLELGHMVTDRASFARGALLALERLQESPPGLYAVEDLY